MEERASFHYTGCATVLGLLSVTQVTAPADQLAIVRRCWQDCNRRRLVAQACPGAGRGPALDCLPAWLLSVRPGALAPLRRLFLERLTASLPSRAPNTVLGNAA
jgi:hypothetical protein